MAPNFGSRTPRVRAQQEHVPIRNLSPEIRALEQNLMLLEQAEIELSQTIQQLKEEMVIQRKGSSALCHLLVLNLKSQYQGIELLNAIAKHIGVDASKIMPNPIGKLCEDEILQLIGLSDKSKPSTQPSQTHQEPFPEVEQQ